MPARRSAAFRHAGVSVPRVRGPLANAGETLCGLQDRAAAVGRPYRILIIDRMEVVMNLKKVFFILVLTGAVIICSISPAFSQVKPGKNIVASGMIELVSRDKKVNADYMMINERKIFISPNTKIMDAWGNPLTLNDLKPGLFALVEAIKNADGSYERKITVKK